MKSTQAHTVGRISVTRTGNPTHRLARTRLASLVGRIFGPTAGYPTHCGGAGQVKGNFGVSRSPVSPPGTGSSPRFGWWVWIASIWMQSIGTSPGAGSGNQREALFCRYTAEKCLSTKSQHHKTPGGSCTGRSCGWLARNKPGNDRDRTQVRQTQGGAPSFHQ